MLFKNLDILLTLRFSSCQLLSSRKLFSLIKEIKLVPEMLNLLGCSKDNFKKLIEKMNYKTLEKDNDMYFRYNPKKQIKKTFKKIDTSNSPFKVLKNLNLN